MADFYIAAQPLTVQPAPMTRSYNAGTPIAFVRAWTVRAYSSSLQPVPTGGGGTPTRPTTGRLWPRPN